MSNFFVDVRQDLFYAYGWPLRLVRPIWKVKQALKRAYPSFQRFLCAIAHHFLGDPDSDVKNAQFFSWTSVKTLSMHTVGHHGFTQFLGDTDFDVKNAQFFVDVCQDLAYAYGWPSRLVGPIWKVKRAPKRAYPSFRRFSCAIAHHFLGDPDSNVKNTKSFHGRPSRPYLCIRFATTASHHFLGDPDSDVKNVKRSPKRAYSSFRRFSCAIAHHFLVIRIPTSKMPNFFMDVRQDLVYAYGWPSRLVRPIWKVKRASKRAYPSFRRFSCAIAHHLLGDPDSDVKNAKFFCGHPSRPCLCIRLAITDCSTHLEGWPSRLVRIIWKVKRALKRAYPSFQRFSCAIAHHFLGDPDSDVKNAKFFRGLLSRLCLCIRLAITACTTHLEGQTSPEASIPIISMIFVCYSTPFFG
uniref:Uncharacterized protein n=1 Tax=Solanum lycopersicum TaxID=4081 RepID=A0A3Q7HI23_SOLLC